MNDFAQTKPKQRLLIIVLGGLVTLFVVLWTGNWLHYRLNHVTSNAGFVKADLVQLAPQVRGQVTEVLVEEGARVEAGQALLKIDAREYDQRLAQAEAIFTRAEMAYQAQKSEAAEAARAEAKAALELARLYQAQTTLVSPIAGIVAKRNVEKGDFAIPGVPAFVLYDPETLHVVVNLEEGKVKNVKLGADTDLFFDASGEVLRGQVVRIGDATAAEFALIPRDVSAGEFTRVVQRVPIKIAIPERSKFPFLRPGLSVSVGVTKG